MKSLTISTAAAALLAACASPTPYEPAGPNDETGYASEQVSADTYRVSFEGNAVTDRKTVETYLLYKAAQVAQNTGHDYFRFKERDTDRQVDVDVNTYSATPGLYGYGAGFGVGGYGFPYTSTYDYGVGTGLGYGSTVTTDDSFEAQGVIELYEERPAGMSDVFDASDVIARLRDEVRTAEQEDDDALGYDVL